MNLCCNKYCEYTRNTGNIKTIHEKDKVNKVYSYCIDCDFIITKIFYKKDISYSREKLSANDLVRYHLLENHDGRFNDVLENTYIKKNYKLDYTLEGLNLIKTDETEIKLRKELMSIKNDSKTSLLEIHYNYDYDKQSKEEIDEFFKKSDRLPKETDKKSEEIDKKSDERSY